MGGLPPGAVPKRLHRLAQLCLLRLGLQQLLQRRQGPQPSVRGGEYRPGVQAAANVVAGHQGVHIGVVKEQPARAFRIAVSGPDGAQATYEPFTRTVFYTHLTYDWETNSITRDTSPAGFYGVQFLSTLVPTLIIEGVLLWLFGFRARRDWLVFLAVNLVTQAGLHLWIAADLISIGDSALQYLVLLVAEVPILLVELITYVFLLKEYSGLRRAAYAACANIASYAVGYLPLHWAVEFLAR